jgi:hypothetical protein
MAVKYDLNYWSFVLTLDIVPFAGTVASGTLDWTPPQSHNFILRYCDIQAVAIYDLTAVGRGQSALSIDCLASLYSDNSATRPICTVPNVTVGSFTLTENGVSHHFSTKYPFEGEIIMPLNGQMHWDIVPVDDPSIISSFTTAQIAFVEYQVSMKIGYTLREKI